MSEKQRYNKIVEIRQHI